MIKSRQDPIFFHKYLLEDQFIEGSITAIEASDNAR